MDSSEAALIRAARRLEREALGQIYDAYSLELYRYAMRLLGDPMRAEDLVAETFARFLRALHGGGGPKTHLRAYLYRVAHNAAVDVYRKEEPVDLSEQEMASDLKEPEQAAEVALRSVRVRQALWELTSDQRQVIVLKYFQGLTNRQVADILDKPVGAIKSLQHRALGALKRVLTVGEDI
ncbi:MAG: sigma-70 family RNA polymerase sigma factor [Anaerolineales bacterium]|jgi:RNA polymerase sigma-70 factor (ECF subfamily)